VNDPPEIMTNWMGSTVFSTWEDQPKPIWLFIYDPDPIGPTEIVEVSAPSHGTIGGNQWNFVYTPPQTFSARISLRSPRGNSTAP